MHQFPDRLVLMAFQVLAALGAGRVISHSVTVTSSRKHQS